MNKQDLTCLWFKCNFFIDFVPDTGFLAFYESTNRESSLIPSTLIWRCLKVVCLLVYFFFCDLDRDHKTVSCSTQMSMVFYSWFLNVRLQTNECDVLLRTSDEVIWSGHTFWNTNHCWRFIIDGQPKWHSRVSWAWKWYNLGHRQDSANLLSLQTTARTLKFGLSKYSNFLSKLAKKQTLVK